MIANICIKPQLTAIYRTLQRLAVEYVQDELPDAFGVIKVVQHLSPACRVASMKVSDNLAAGQILRHIDDRDIRNFRVASDIKLPLLFLSVVAIPVLIGVFSEAAGDLALDTVLPSAFSMFILAHYIAWSVSPLLVIVPYIATILWILFRRPLYHSAERRLHARCARQQDAKLDTDSWRVRRGTPLDTNGNVFGIVRMYCTAQFRQWSACCLDMLSLVTVCIGSGGRSYFPFQSASIRDKLLLQQWEKMNIPQSLQGKIVNNVPTKAKDKTPNQLCAVPVIPERIQRLTKDPSVRWDIEEGPPSEGNDSRGPDYLLSLLGLGDLYLLQPSVLSAEESAAQVGTVLQVGTCTSSTQYQQRCAAAHFRREHTFPTSSKSAIVRAITSYREQMQAGKLYYLSLYDEQLLTSAENDKQLLRYAGFVHVRDLACMLEEILYFYRPEGEMLSEKVMKRVFCAYDEWIQEHATPLSQDVLTAIRQLLNFHKQNKSQNESTSTVGSSDAADNVGFFQEHKLVAAMRLKSILAEEIKIEHHQSVQTSNRNGRECVRWSDIRCILDRTYTNEPSWASKQASLRFAQNSPTTTGITSGSVKTGSTKSGSNKYPVLQSIAARASQKRRRTEKVTIAHSVAPFDVFARWLYYLLKDVQVENEHKERKALRIEMALLQDQQEELKCNDAGSNQIDIKFYDYFSLNVK